MQLTNSDFYFINILIKHKKTQTKSNSSSKIQSGALTCSYLNSTSLTKLLYHKPLQIPISDFKLLATFDLLLVFSLIDFRLILFLKNYKPQYL